MSNEKPNKRIYSNADEQRSFFETSSPRGGGGYLSTVCGTGTCHFLGVLFSNHYGIMGIIFTIFLTFHGIMGVLFRGFFIIYGIMAQIFIRFVELWP